MNRKPNCANILISILIGLTMILSAVQPVVVSASDSGVQGDGIRRGYHAQTGMLTFLGADTTSPIRVGKAMERGLSPEARGFSNLEMYAREFGIQDAQSELSVMKSTDEDDRQMVRYQQVFNGIPILAGELNINMKEDGSLLSINGEVSPDLNLDIRPQIIPEVAKRVALLTIAKSYNLGIDELKVSEPELWIFDERLMQENATQPVQLVWRMEVTSENYPLRELVLVNAQTGDISLHFNQIDTAWEGVPVPNPVQREKDNNHYSAARHVPVPVLEASILPDLEMNIKLAAPDPADIDRYVSPTGSDTTNCDDKDNPCRSITYAFNRVVSEGEIIAVAEGVYVNSNPARTTIVEIITDQYVHTFAASIYGGWNSEFSTQVGFSTLDGEKLYRGLSIGGYPHKTMLFDRFMVTNCVKGGVYNSMNLIMANSSIFGNNNIGDYASGGGIYSYTGNLTLYNVTVSNNFASSSGGGVWSSNGNTILNNVTITNNEAYEGGGLVTGPGATRTIRNSILYGNHATHLGPDCYAAFSATGNNIVGDTSYCSIPAGNGNQLNVNPQMGFFIEGAGYQPLLSGSPAIDAGLNCYDTVDQRGYSRVGACDIGAYEFPSSTGSAARMVIATGDEQRTAPLTAFETPLAVALLDSQGSPVDGVSVTFTAPSSGASVTFLGGGTSTSVNSASGGIASILPTANEIAGSYSVTAESSGMTSLSFDEQNIAWYVKPDGDDLNDCNSPATACATIEGAVGKMLDGETIFVASGTYSTTEINAYVVYIDKRAVVRGGWDSTFAIQDGYSIIDGYDTNPGLITANVVVSVDRFIFQYGSSIMDGGGIYNDGTLTLTNSIIRNNSADFAGGGISNKDTLIVENVLIHDNSSWSGGGISNTGSSLEIRNSGIYNNSAYEGGGIYGGGTVRIYNSTINGNEGYDNGGGIWSESGRYSLNNVTISNNHADYGGGIYNANSYASSFLIKNTILGGNTASKGGPDCGNNLSNGGVKSTGNSLISKTTGCRYTSGVGDLVNVNPLLGTFLPNRGYHPLRAGSPAINAGASCYGIADQRGVARIGACDIGSYEYDPVGAATFIEIVSGDLQRTAPNFRFLQTFSIAILDDNGSPVSGQSLTFQAPASGPSGTFTNGLNQYGPITTDGGGLAASTAFTANGELGEYLVSAVADFGSVDFHLANMALYVDPAGSDANDCLSVPSACATIQGAVDKARKGDAIMVAEGIYNGTDSQVVNLTKNVSLFGGWDPTFTTQSGFSTISGNGLRSGIVVSEGVTASAQRFVVTRSWSDTLQKGGIYNSGTFSMSQCEISYNTPHDWGGGVYNKGTLTLTDCNVTNNEAMTYGGGIYNSGSLVVKHSVIANNGSGRLSPGSQAYGGGIYSQGIANISDSLIIENDGFMGAGIYSIGVINISRVSISQNISANGGGLFLTGTASMLNSTVYGNSASGPGGGIFASGVTLTLNNATVSGNTASSGGGIYKDGGSGKITIRNSILGGNAKTTGSGPDCNGTIVSGGYNIIKSTTGCTVTAMGGDQFNKDPQLGIYLPVQGYQPIRSTSPAVNSANAANCLPTDQRGVSRVGRCDRGAYEYTVPGAAAQVTVPDWNTYHVTPGKPLSVPLQATVLDAKGSPVSGVVVTFTAPASGPSGLFSTTNDIIATATSVESGIATAPTYTANDQQGDYTISASISFDTAEFKLVNLAWFVSTTGSNGNDCQSPLTPCADVQGTIQKPDFASNDIVNVAIGTYDLAGTRVLSIPTNLTIQGGWDASFTAQTGASIFNDGIIVTQIYPEVVVKLRNLVIENTGGTAIYNSGNIVIIENSTIRNNETGIENRGKTTVINTTISGNTGGDGGIYNPEIGLPVNTVSVINSTISGNRPIGIMNYEGSGAFTISNSIIIGNINPLGPDDDCSGKFISGGHNLIGNIGVPGTTSTCPTDWSSTDIYGTRTHPIASAKVLYATLVQDLLSGQWYHPLKLGSLAIDAGNTAPPGTGGNTCPATDQLGVPRPQGVYCDIGAVEYQFNHYPTNPLLGTYTANHSTILPGTLTCSGNDATCASTDTHVTKAHEYAFSTYTKYLDWHGRDSLDGNGMQINSVVHYGSNYKNAYWNGSMMIYGDGYGYPLADDIVAHELTHAVTQYESNLFYWYQSGAINESFSDLWGEAVDQNNGLGNDTTTVKWLIGEGVTGLGAIRKMSYPPAFGDPDSMTSSLYCKSGVCLKDNGGIHTNSGVNNKAVSLLVDGGTFNGRVVRGLGWLKVLPIYYEAQTNMLTAGSDYLDLYNALYQACLNKIGTNGIIFADCTEVRDATLAVKMNQAPATNFNPDAPYCPANTHPAIPNLFYENFETGTDGWTIGKLSGKSAWGLSGNNPKSGKASLWADDSFEKSDSFATTRSIHLPAGVNAHLHFSHTFSFETTGTSNYDGGVLEYSTNNGTTWTDATALFSLGKNYKGLIINGFGNPLQGRSAFAGDSHGYVSSRYNLTSLAGKTVRFRWRMGTDSGGSVLGWYLDDVRVYRCVSN